MICRNLIVNFFYLHLSSSILSGQEPQFNIIKNGLMATANEPYNLNSLMHYKNREFSKNGLDTIQSRTDPNLPLGNYFLSKVGVLQINKLLDCPTRYWDGNTLFIFACDNIFFPRGYIYKIRITNFSCCSFFLHSDWIFYNRIHNKYFVGRHRRKCVFRDKKQKGW